MFFWKSGRQNNSYQKLAIWNFSFSDCYILWYGSGAGISPHRDPIPNRKHYRLNIVLKGHAEFICDSTIFRTKRIVLFRPDINTHSVKNGNKPRYVLSIGVAI